MNQPIHEFSGESLYLDTMIFYLFLRVKDSTANLLFRRIQDSEFQAFTSVLTFDERAYRLLLARIRDNYPGNPLDQLRQNEQERIAEFSSEIESVLSKLQIFPNLSLIDLVSTDLATFCQNMQQYHFRPRDALHLAAMQKVSCSAIVSQDSDFDHIADIQCYKLS
ncbi:MAG: type II toxin-antitoxin system VapC family toxin [Chloroflexota bacterium]